MITGVRVRVRLGLTLTLTLTLTHVLEGFDGVDKLKPMSKQVEYLISFNAIKLLSPIQLLQQYGLSGYGELRFDPVMIALKAMNLNSNLSF